MYRIKFLIQTQMKSSGAGYFFHQILNGLLYLFGIDYFRGAPLLFQTLVCSALKTSAQLLTHHK